jgi:hypothetical protein
MRHIEVSSALCNGAVIALPRPRIEHAADCNGLYVLRHDSGALSPGVGAVTMIETKLAWLAHRGRT